MNKETQALARQLLDDARLFREVAGLLLQQDPTATEAADRLNAQADQCCLEVVKLTGLLTQEGDTK